MSRLDLGFVRAQFPAFVEPSLRGEAFFENAGGSYVCGQVIERLAEYYRRLKVQPYYRYAASTEAGEWMDAARARLAEYLNVTPDEVHFGPSTSQNTYVLAQALRKLLRAGDEIVVTNQEHEANTRVFRRLAADGVTVREWRVDRDSGALHPAALDELLGERTKLVAVTHCSNVVAHINPIAEITEKARAAGAITIVDGVAFAPHGLPDVTALGADVYLFSLYKTYGPHQGVMAIRPSLAGELPNQGHFFNETQPRKRLVPAGPDHAQIAAASGIVDYLEKVAEIAGTGVQGAGPFRIAHNAMRQQEIGLMAPLLNYLRKKNGIRLIGPDDPNKRAPTISIATDRPAAHVAGLLARHNIGVGAGHFYAYRLLEALGINPAHGVLRLSFVHYTSPEEIDRLIKALETEL